MKSLALVQTRVSRKAYSTLKRAAKADGRTVAGFVRKWIEAGAKVTSEARLDLAALNRDYADQQRLAASRNKGEPK